MNLLRKRLKTKYILNLILSIIITILIMSITLKLTNNFSPNINMVSKNKHIIEKTLEYNAYTAEGQLENLHDIKENLEIIADKKINKFKNKVHKFHFEKFLHII